MSWIVTGIIGGYGLGQIFGGGNDSAPQPITNNYGESMESALDAQVKMAPELYKAESSEEYGRPAYARMQSDIMREQLLGGKNYGTSGEKLSATGYDDEGFQFEEVVSQEAIDQPWSDGVVNNQEDWDKKFLPALQKAMADGTISKDEGQQLAIDSMLNGTNGVQFAGKPWSEYGTQEQKTKREYVLDDSGQKVKNENKAGTFERTNTGTVGLIAGDQKHQFTDGKFRKTGYDENDVFMGTSQTEQDLFERAKTQQLRTEIGLAKQYGSDLTNSYRGNETDLAGNVTKKGDIQKALDAVTKLRDESSAVPDQISDGNRSLFNLANQFSNSKVESPYQDGTTQSSGAVGNYYDPNIGMQQDAMLTSWEQRKQRQGANPSTSGQPSMSQAGDLTQNRGVSALSAGGLSTDGNVNTQGSIETATFDPLAIDSVNPTGTIGKASQGTGSIRDVLDGKDTIPTVNDRGSVERASQGSSAIRSVGLSDGIRDASQGTSAVRDIALKGTIGDASQGSGAVRDVGSLNEIRDVSQGSLQGTNFNASNTQGNISSEALGDMGGLRSALSSSGLQALNDGGDLSARELRNIQQDARSASTARGRSRDMSSIMSEVQNSAGARRQRLNENRAFAQGALGQEGAFRQDEAGRGQQVDLANMQRGMAYDQRADALTSQSNALLGDQQARSLQASMANQQADIAGRGQGLQSQIANQQSDISNLDRTLQASIANQQRDLASRSQDYQSQASNQQADLANRDRSLQSSIANQQADLAGRGQGLQAQVVNQQSDISNRDRTLQASIANRQGDLAIMNTDLQSQLANQGVAVGKRERQLQANLANQQSDITQRNLDLQESTTNLNRDLSVQNNKLQSDLANQQTQMGIQNMNLQASSANQGADINLMNANLQADLANQQNLNNFRNREFQANLTNQGRQMDLLGMDMTAQQANVASEMSRNALLANTLDKDYSRELATRQLNEQMQQSGLAQNRQFALQNVGLQQATSADALMAITGRATGASIGTGQNIYGNGQLGLSAQPQLYNMAQGAQWDLDQSAMLNNYNMNNYASNQAKQAGMFGAIAGTAGTIASSAIACWVAREVYGINNPEWLQFREYLFSGAPSWFRKLYLKFGERFAEFISDKPRLKSIIKKWMDSKIKGGK